MSTRGRAELAAGLVAVALCVAGLPGSVTAAGAAGASGTSAATRTAGAAAAPARRATTASTRPAATHPAAARARTAATTARAAAWRAIAIAEDQRRPWTEVLAPELRARDAVVRARAALAVGRLQDSTSVTGLLPLLRDPTPAVREEAVFALGQIGQRSARPALEAVLATGTPALRQLAIEALGKLGDHAATRGVAAFLGDRSAALRGEAAVALWRLADSTALDALLAHHRDPDAGVRWRVLFALEKIPAPDRVVPAMMTHTRDADWLSRAYAARTIGREKSPRGTAALLAMLDDRESAVVVNALRGLELIGDSTCEACLPDLVKALGHADPHVRVTAAGVLAARFVWTAADTTLRGAAVDSLAGRLADPDAATRGAVARALIGHAGVIAISAVKPLLDDPSIYTRVAVLQALGQLPAARATPLLLERTAPGRPLFERMTAAEALGTLKAADALPTLRAGLADSSVLYAASAASALGEIGDKAVIPDLARVYEAHVHDPDADARIAIRDALKQLAGAAFADSVEHAHPAPPPAASYDAGFEDPSPWRGAVLHTTKGDIEWAFARDAAVQTVKNFARLAARGYFDGRAVHRVVPNFVIQDGDPTGTGSGGPGYTIRCEYNRLRYEPGMVGMALSGKDTGGSQWFITHSPQPHLNGKYTIFARVTRGMDVVRAIVQGDRITKVELLK